MLDMFGGTCIAIGNGIISINALLAILSKHHCTEMQSIENLTELPSLTYNLDIDIIWHSCISQPTFRAYTSPVVTTVSWPSPITPMILIWSIRSSPPTLTSVALLSGQRMTARWSSGEFHTDKSILYASVLPREHVEMDSIIIFMIVMSFICCFYLFHPELGRHSGIKLWILSCCRSDGKPYEIALSGGKYERNTYQFMIQYASCK